MDVITGIFVAGGIIYGIIWWWVASVYLSVCYDDDECDTDYNGDKQCWDDGDLYDCGDSDITES